MIKKTGLFIFVLIVLMSAGCWNKKEPKNLAIVNSVLYNKVGDSYIVVAEFLNLSGSSKKNGGSSSGESVITLTSKGDTLREAIADGDKSIEKNLYGGHNHVRFFSESLAREGIADLLDFLLRDHLTDESPLIVVIKGENPEKIYACSTGLSDAMGVYIDNLSVTQPKSSSASVFVTTLDFIKDFFNDGKQPVAGVVQIVKSEEEKDKAASGEGSSGGSSEEKTKIVYSGLAAFRNGQLVGFYDDIQARAYNFITGNIGVAIISVPYHDSHVVCEVTGASSDIKTQIEDKNATIDVKIKAKIRIVADATDKNVSDLDIMKEIEGEFNKKLLPQIASTIETAQHEFKSDIFGFGSSVHTQNPEDWKRIKEEWDQIFPTATVTVSVESNVYQTGETKDSVLSEFAED